MSQKRSRKRIKKAKKPYGKKFINLLFILVLLGTAAFASVHVYHKLKNQNLEQESKKQVEEFKIVKLEINEGDTIASLSKKIAANFPKLNMTEQQIVSKLNDREYITSLQQRYAFIPDQVKEPSVAYPLEGLLQPLTYQYYENATLNAIIDKPLSEMKHFYDEYNPQLQGKGVSFYEALTLASITNAEVPSNDKVNLSLVAQVFLNRLKAGMGLGSDATLAYQLQKKDLTNDDFKNAQDSLYNTRIHKGLTPTPIQFVTENAMVAVITPKANSNYYFLTGTCSGREDFTQFYYAKSYEEHQENIRKHMVC